MAPPASTFAETLVAILAGTGIPADSHEFVYSLFIFSNSALTRVLSCSTVHMVVPDSKPVRCPECGCAYQVDYQGAEDSHDHHH